LTIISFAQYAYEVIEALYKAENAKTVKRIVAILNEQIASMEADREEDLPHSFISDEFQRSL
jgi:hypothetical protein